MLRSKKIYTKICVECGVEFKTEGVRRRLCHCCRENAHKKYQIQYHKKLREREKSDNSGQNNKKPRFHRTLPDTVPIKEFVSIIELYNQKHSTNYTYGKFELLMLSDKITREEINDLQREKKVTNKFF